MFRHEIRSVYRIAGEELVRQSTRVHIVTGSGELEHPFAGSDPTFLEMFGLAQASNPAEFDYDNRIWPRLGDAFNTGIAAAASRSVSRASFAISFSSFRRCIPSRREGRGSRTAVSSCQETRRTPRYTRRLASTCSHRNIRRRSIEFGCNTLLRASTNLDRSHWARRRCVRAPIR